MLEQIDWNQIINRVIRIIKFDKTVWEEIEHDESANVEAGVIVVATAILSAIGSLLVGGGVIGILMALIIAPLLRWLLWSWVTMFVGTKLFEGETDFWEMARMVGYANAPSVLGLLAFIPCVGALVGLAASVLSLVLGFFAVREALDLPTEKAIITIVIGWAIVLLISFGLAALGLGAGVGAGLLAG